MDEWITPQVLITYFASRRGIDVAQFKINPVVVMTWCTPILNSLVERTGAERWKLWAFGGTHPLYQAEVQGRKLSIAHLPMGAPATVMAMEEMIALGARVFIGLGIAGGLQPSAPVGSILLPTSCLSEEGTSRHYVDDMTKVGPSLNLMQGLRSAADAAQVKLVPGPQWSCDAFYRELVSKIEAYRRQGVLAVDMETSATYALGQFHGVDVCNLLVVSDEVWETWRPAYGTPEQRRGEENAVKVVLDWLKTQKMTP